MTGADDGLSPVRRHAIICKMLAFYHLDHKDEFQWGFESIVCVRKFPYHVLCWLYSGIMTILVFQWCCVIRVTRLVMLYLNLTAVVTIPNEYWPLGSTRSLPSQVAIQSTSQEIYNAHGLCSFDFFFWFGNRKFNQSYFRVTSSDNRMIALVPDNESTKNCDITKTNSTINSRAYFMPCTIYTYRPTIRIVVHGRYLVIPTFPRAYTVSRGTQNYIDPG